MRKERLRALGVEQVLSCDGLLELGQGFWLDRVQAPPLRTTQPFDRLNDRAFRRLFLGRDLVRTDAEVLGEKSWRNARIASGNLALSIRPGFERHIALGVEAHGAIVEVGRADLSGRCRRRS